MSHFTDEQFDQWLNDWAVWVTGGCSIAALGYKSQSIEQDVVQLNKSNQSPLVNTSMHDMIERAVSVLAQQDRLAADVGRMEYGCHKRSHDPMREKPSQKKNAAILDIHPKTYSRKLADFRLAVRMSVSLFMGERMAA